MNPDPSISQDPDSTPNWLPEWKAAERVPLFYSDSPNVWRMLEAVWLSETVEFQYFGGSTPGTLRRVTPRRVFNVEGCRGTYAEGYCHLRNEIRVFRLNLVEWPLKQG